VGEYNVRALGLKQRPKLIVSIGIHDGVAIALSGKQGPRLKNGTSALSLRDTNATASRGVRLRTALFTAIQIQQCDRMSKLRIPGDGASAAVFRISRMTADDDDFELSRLRHSFSGETCQGEQRQDMTAADRTHSIYSRPAD